MTRINCISPYRLSRAHCHAEYRELPRIFTAVRKANGLVGALPDTYRMGEGHCKFFYDKLLWLYNRYADLCKCLLTEHHYKLDLEMYCQIRKDAHTLLQEYPHLCNDWTPSCVDIDVNMRRLVERDEFFYRRAA